MNLVNLSFCSLAALCSLHCDGNSHFSFSGCVQTCDAYNMPEHPEVVCATSRVMVNVEKSTLRFMVYRERCYLCEVNAILYLLVKMCCLEWHLLVGLMNRNQQTSCLPCS